jgi:hypothetical protein
VLVSVVEPNDVLGLSRDAALMSDVADAVALIVDLCADHCRDPSMVRWPDPGRLPARAGPGAFKTGHAIRTSLTPVIALD